MQLTQAQEELLKKIIGKLNEDSLHSYRIGELDHIPEEWTEEAALNMILLKYALNNFPELVDGSEPDAGNRR